MAKKSFEEALERLEAITRELENGNLDLEGSLKKFEEGVRLADFLSARLDIAQKKIDGLLHPNGENMPAPDEEESNDGHSDLS